MLRRKQRRRKRTRRLPIDWALYRPAASDRLSKSMRETDPQRKSRNGYLTMRSRDLSRRPRLWFDRGWEKRKGRWKTSRSRRERWGGCNGKRWGWCVRSWLVLLGIRSVLRLKCGWTWVRSLLRLSRWRWAKSPLRRCKPKWRSTRAYIRHPRGYRIDVPGE